MDPYNPFFLGFVVNPKSNQLATVFTNGISGGSSLSGYSSQSGERVCSFILRFHTKIEKYDELFRDSTQMKEDVSFSKITHFPRVHMKTDHIGQGIGTTGYMGALLGARFAIHQYQGRTEYKSFKTGICSGKGNRRAPADEWWNNAMNKYKIAKQMRRKEIVVDYIDFEEAKKCGLIAMTLEPEFINRNNSRYGNRYEIDFFNEDVIAGCDYKFLCDPKMERMVKRVRKYIRLCHLNGMSKSVYKHIIDQLPSLKK